MEKKFSTKSIIMIGMFAAVLAALSQISFPLPSGVPVTLQTFAVALTAYVLGWKLGTVATIVYVLLGGIGVPVFAGFSGGVSSLVGMSGGFIWGFILMTLLCGLGMAQKNKVLLVVLSALGLAVCHLLGVLQFSAVADSTFGASFLLVSVPYLIKDIVSVAAAYFIAVAVRKALASANLLYEM